MPSPRSGPVASGDNRPGSGYADHVPGGFARAAPARSGELKRARGNTCERAAGACYASAIALDFGIERDRIEVERGIIYRINGIDNSGARGARRDRLCAVTMPRVPHVAL